MNKVIQSLWVGPRLSTMERLAITSYLANGHRFHLYVYQDTKNVPEGTTVLDANEIVPASRIFQYGNVGFGNGSYAGFADVFRYRLLFRKGGWWVDTDSICLRPFDFIDDYVFSSEWAAPSLPYHENCGNLKAPVESPFYGWLCAKTEQVDNKHLYWGMIGPRLVREAVERFGFERFVKQPATFCPIRYDAKAVNIIGCGNTWEAGDSYAVHLWNEAWRVNNIGKDGEFDSRCVYEQLKKRYGVQPTATLKLVASPAVRPLKPAWAPSETRPLR